MTDRPVLFSPEVEDVQPYEAETIAEVNEIFDGIMQTTATDYGHAVRAVHAKAHAVLEGVFTVDAGLPPELAQGLFAQAGGHKAYLRFSTNAGDILPDDIVLPRGLALKVLDVDGERLSTEEGTAQDFIMINGPVFMAKNTEDFAGSLKLLARTTDKMEGAKEMLSGVLGAINKALGAIGLPSTTLAGLGGAPNVDPLGETYFSVTPFRYGDYIAKFSLAPVSKRLTDLTGKEVIIAGNPNAIRDQVRQEMRTLEGSWEFRVQLCRDLEKQPVEDPTKEWKAEDSPWLRVGTLTVGPQDSWEPARVTAVDEAMRFSVWTGLAAHQPLGNINRARRDAYKHSADFRARFNRCPIREP